MEKTAGGSAFQKMLCKHGRRALKLMHRGTVERPEQWCDMWPHCTISLWAIRVVWWHVLVIQLKGIAIVQARGDKGLSRILGSIFRKTSSDCSDVKCLLFVIIHVCAIQVSPCLPVLSRLLFSSDPDLLADACWALSYLSDGPNDKIQAVIDSGVCRRLVELLM